MNWIKQRAIYILILFQTIGFIGVFSPYPQYFKLLTPFHLILVFGLTLLTATLTRNLIYWLIFCFLFGFMMEVVGVATGFPFGNYSYGATLGLKLLNVPLVIGLNWAMLSWLTFSMSQSVGLNPTLQPFVGAAFMTILDSFIEPIAPVLDYWTWSNDEVPVQNFIAWFCIAFIMQWLGQWLKISIKSNFAWQAYLVQLLFFAGLLFLIR